MRVQATLSPARAEVLKLRAQRWLQILAGCSSCLKEELEAIEAQQMDRHFMATRHGMQYAMYDRDVR